MGLLGTGLWARRRGWHRARCIADRRRRGDASWLDYTRQVRRGCRAWIGFGITGTLPDTRAALRVAWQDGQQAPLDQGVADGAAVDSGLSVVPQWLIRRDSSPGPKRVPLDGPGGGAGAEQELQ
jgi:hypothetical protein